MALGSQNAAPPLKELDPDWFPLRHAAFSFRASDPEGKGDFSSPTALEVLEARLLVEGVVAAEIDPAEATFIVSTEDGNWGFHPDHVDDAIGRMLAAAVLGRDEASALLQAVNGVWKTMREEFACAIRAGEATVFGRLGSPFTGDFIKVPTDAAHEFEVLDWDRARARSAAGDVLYSVHVAGASIGEDSADPAYPHKRALALKLIRERFGHDIPSIEAMNHTEFCGEVTVHAQKTKQRCPSRETILTAAGRAPVPRNSAK